MTIGFGPANEDGTGLDWAGTQLSLFDISDPTDPQQANTLRLSPVAQQNEHMWSWSWSEATYEHKAFQYWAPKELLAVPLSTYRSVEWYEDGRYYWSYKYISKLVLVHVNETEGTLTTYGEVNHSSLYDGDEEERRWWDDRNIRRSIFMGDFIYAISSAGVTVTNLTTMEETASLTIPHSSAYRYDSYGEDVAVSDGAEDDSEASSSDSGESDRVESDEA